MMTTKVKINAVRLGNGHLIIGYSYATYFVHTEDGIMSYTPYEMNEIYGISYAWLGVIAEALQASTR